MDLVTLIDPQTDRRRAGNLVRTCIERPLTRRIVFLAVLAALGAVALLPRAPRAFTADRSLTITAPLPLAKVAAPFTVSWQAPPGRYGVFLDRAPISVGRDLRQAVGSPCNQTPSCQPDLTALESTGVYVSSEGTVEVASLPELENLGSDQAFPVHEITIIPLDDLGRRVGTSFWQVQFHGETRQ